MSLNLAKIKQRYDKLNARKGLLLGAISGLTFGLFGIIVSISGSYSPLVFAGAIIAPVVASAIADVCASIWLFIYNARLGKLKEIGRTIRSKPGKMIMLGAICGGPIANAAYLVGIANAGATYAIPVSAAFPLVGAIFARFLFNEKIILRVAAGMILVIVGIIIVSYAPPEGNVPNFYLGVILAAIAAIGWGIEGAISSFGGSLLDPSISITLRQFVSSICYILILIPVISYLFPNEGDALYAIKVFIYSIGTPKILFIILASAIIYAISFLTWYQAFAIIGTAKTMALNATYVFWGIAFAIILQGQELSLSVLLGAPILLIGTIIVCMNPLDFFKKESLDKAVYEQ